MSSHLFFTSTKSGCLWKCPSLLLAFPAWSLVSDTITYTGDNLTSDPLHSLKSVDNHSIADRARVTPHSPTSFWDRRLKEERKWKKKQQGETHERHETVSRSNKWHGIWLVEPHGSYANMQDRMREQIIQEFNFLKMFCQCPEQLHPSRTHQSSIYRSRSELVDRDTKMGHRSVLMGHRQRGKQRDVLMLKYYEVRKVKEKIADCI